MKPISALLYVALASPFTSPSFGQEWRPVAPQANSITGQRRTGKDEHRYSSMPTQKNTDVGPTDRVFPHLAIGGGWETLMVIVNLSDTTVDFTQDFYDTSGQPMEVTFQSIPDGQVTTTAATAGSLRPGASFNILMTGSDRTQTGWASLDYDSSNARLGGYVAFRYLPPGSRTIPEALVPLSAYDDYKFFMPFDNLEGFDTGIALANPAGNTSTTVTIRALSLSGDLLATDVLTLGPNSQTSFVLKDHMPTLVNRMGTLQVEGSSNRLSAIGIRLNATAGFTFTSVPVLNWSAMF